MWMEQFNFGRALAMTAFVFSMAFLFSITFSVSP
jgi:hypothetical protein